MIDILYTEDLEIKNGDFHLGNSDNQHTQHLLIADKGEYKANPELGAGITHMLNTEDPMDFLIEAKKNLQYDGMKVQNIAFTENGKLDINATYTT